MASIQQIYIALFGRPADPGGLEFYQDRTNNGANLEPILGQLANSPEYLDRFAGQSQEEMINQIYMDLFNRPADDEGLAFYLDRLESGEMNIGNIAVAILDGAQNADAEIIANKTAYANAFTASLDTEAERDAYNPDTVDLARDFISSIGADDDMVDQGRVDMVVNNIATANPNAITLTAETGEAIMGTAGADQINGVIGGDNATVNTFDTINGGAGNDTLNLVVSASDDTVADPVDPQIRNVETINARFVEAGAVVSLANATGVQTVSASESTAFGQFTEIGNVSNFRVSDQGSVGFEGATAATLNLTLTNVADPDLDVQNNLELATIDFDDIVAGTLNVNVRDSAAALGVANISGGVQGEDTIEQVSINSTGTTGLNVIGMSGTNNLTDITITGDQTLTLAAGTVADGAMPTDGIDADGSDDSDPEFAFDGFTAVETVNASSFTGDLTILGLANAEGDVTVRSGSGNDTITTGVGDDLLVGGAGNDTLTGGAGDDIYGGVAGNDTINLDGGGNDEVHFDAGTGTDTINDFDVSGSDIDVISFLDNGAISFANSSEDMVRGDADLDAADFSELTSLSATTTADDQKVVLLDGSYTTSQLTGGLGAEAEFYLVAQNSETGNAEIYYDADWSDAAGREQIATLVGVDANNLTLNNFDVY
ncbi:hypothetical protein GCM10007989_12020 [Devosia pacifica]|uniref:DUF4214 domain-containing protein n=1 Tax=Devosia pacifica TaxID=1335967 RepID=A0A918S139_9HYPH|nr:calcium-binding protein [Devosia pacifica]GHA18322.1 hypothetical protein GCM10007989_12020 [Devosia pacifica]